MDYKEQRRVSEAVNTIDWLKDRVEELEAENEKLNQLNDDLEYQIGVLRGTEQP